MIYAFLINAYTWINFLNIKIIEIFFEEKKFKPGWLIAVILCSEYCLFEGKKSAHSGKTEDGCFIYY